MQTQNPPAPAFKKAEALAAAQAGKLEKNTLHAIIDNAARFGLTSDEVEIFRVAFGRKNRRAARVAEKERKQTETRRSSDLKPVLWSADKHDPQAAPEKQHRSERFNDSDVDSSDDDYDNFDD